MAAQGPVESLEAVRVRSLTLGFPRKGESINRQMGDFLIK